METRLLKPLTYAFLLALGRFVSLLAMSPGLALRHWPLTALQAVYAIFIALFAHFLAGALLKRSTTWSRTGCLVTVALLVGVGTRAQLFLHTPPFQILSITLIDLVWWLAFGLTCDLAVHRLFRAPDTAK